MGIIKCKMCGGDLVITPGSTVCECEYCGTMQTVPSMDDEKKLVLFERAERLRKNCDFDKAAGVYESIVADFRQEAEAYWGLVLCKYGVEYVDDPATGKKIPTCHRSSFESVMEDADLEMTLENADVVARKVYREEAKQLEEIRKGIVEVSSKEEPYDIFICYKETDEKGERTLDSVLAQDIYTMFTEKGYRVFFSRITLEDKLGQEYEPYIFAALNSAKVMLAVGTDYEYYNAVWVKNEWSRFLKLIASGKHKTLIPCYKNIDAYDMPKEFAKLQAQDLGKVGAMQDLLRGVEKILDTKPSVTASVGIQGDDLNKSYIYNNALEKAEKNNIKSVKTAIKSLASISGWQDADKQREILEKKLKKLKTIRAVIIAIILLIIGGIGLAGLSWYAERSKATFANYYQSAESYYAEGQYKAALKWYKNAERYAVFAGKTEEINEKIVELEKLMEERDANRIEGLNKFNEICKFYENEQIGFVGTSSENSPAGMFTMYVEEDRVVWSNGFDGLTIGEALYNGEGIWNFYGRETTISLTADLFFVARFENNKFIVTETFDGGVATGTYASGQEGYAILEKYVRDTAKDNEAKATAFIMENEKFVTYLGDGYLNKWNQLLIEIER